MMRDMGMDVQALRDAPVLDPVLSYYYDEFKELSRSRSYTHGFPLSIPISEIKAYCEFSGLDAIESEELRVYIRIFDDTWLGVKGEKSKKESEITTR
jgi:hypothetical protein